MNIHWMRTNSELVENWKHPLPDGCEIVTTRKQRISIFVGAVRCLIFILFLN